MPRVAKYVVLAALALAVCACPALAQYSIPIEAVPGAESSGVWINGRVALKLQGATGTASFARARATAEKLGMALQMGVDAGSLSAAGDKKQAAVFAAGYKICTVTRLDMKRNRSEALALAQTWARNIRRLLLLPPISLQPLQLVVPVSETRRLSVGGVATGPISVKVADPTVVSASPDDVGRMVLIQGLRTGSTSIDVTVSGETETSFVDVRKYAGRIPSLGEVQVTGNPCTPCTIAEAVRTELLQKSFAEPGARVVISEMTGADKPLDLSGTRTVRALVDILGGNYITYSAEALVSVRNVPVPVEKPDVLFYSNAPERVTKYQNLYIGQVREGTVARLLYHHQNWMGKKMRFVVELLNTGMTSSTFRLMQSEGSPMVDTYAVGYAAGSTFMKNNLGSVGYIQTIPPNTRLVLMSSVMDHNRTASGILQIRQLSGDCILRVMSLQPEQDAYQPGVFAPAPNPAVFQLSDHVYPTPVRDIEAKYEVGKRWAFVPIGRYSIPKENGVSKLAGNYGVSYYINVETSNPTEATRKVSVIFEATAGIAFGAFMIDGQFISLKYAQPHSETSLITFELRPGQSRTLRIVTLPLAGSNYPAQLVVRS